MAYAATHFELYQDAIGQWRWRILAGGNGKIVGDSAEGYVHRADCVAGLKIVAAVANPPPIWDVAAKKWVNQ